MTTPGVPEWASAVPNLSSLHNPPAQTGGNQVTPFTEDQLRQFGTLMIRAIIGQTCIFIGSINVNGFQPLGFLIPIGHSIIGDNEPIDTASWNWLGDLGSSIEAAIEGIPIIGPIIDAILGEPGDLDDLANWANGIHIAVIQAIKNLTGIDYTSLDTFLASLTEVLTTGGPLVQGLVTQIFQAAELLEDIPLIGPILGSIADLIHKLRFGGIAVNAGNIFGRLQLPQMGSGVSISDLTTEVPNLAGPFSALWVPEADGWSFDEDNDAAKVVCDGTTKTLYDEGVAIKVEPDQSLNLAFRVQYAGVTSGPGETIQLILYTYASSDGSGPATPVVIDGISNPSGTIGTAAVLGDLSWEVPAGVGSVRPVLRVDESVTAGTVYWLNTPLIKKSLWPGLADGLPAAIQDRINEIQATWNAFKGGAGGSVADIPTALNNAGQGLRDALAQALGHAGTGHTAADILGYFQAIPKHVVDGLEDIFDEIKDVFDGNPVTPANPVGDAIKTWWDIFFGGGPKQVVSQDQVAVESGIPPTDADNVIPWVYLPPELTPAAIGHPWVELTKVGSQTLNRTAATKMTGWTQAGGFPLTEPFSGEYRVPFDGLFHIKARVGWTVSPDIYGTLRLDVNGNTYRSDRQITDGQSNLAYNEIDEFVPLAATDTFTFFAQWDGTGTTKDISASPSSYVRITYIGATHLTSTPIPSPTVTFDAKGTADNGSGDGGWSHTFGANSKTIVIPFSHESPDMPTITCGPYNVPVLSGPTYIGNYFGFNARYSLAAAILPDAVKGTTRAITVDFPSGNAAFSGNSLSFNNVAYLGGVRASSGNGGAGDPARMLVPSNAFSQVAGGFGGMDVNFSGFNRTQDNIWNFIAGNTWAHVMGHAQGGLEFTASAGKWAGKFIELHP